MSRVIWDAQGARVFQVGIDRGMLYVPPLAGVAWNGLTGISEEPAGGSSNVYYIDGQAYLSTVSLEEYVSTISAFSSPAEFAPCAGFMSMSPGLYATGQPRQSFGFSYRSLVGDDVLGTALGYKVHLVYNATAKTSDFARESTSDTPNVKDMSWQIMTVPEAVDGFRPTSHFVIDSRKIDPAILSSLEDTLYGTVSSDPRLLTPSELVALVMP